MKRSSGIRNAAVTVALFEFITQGAFAQLPNPTYGWNLGNTLEPPSGVGTWGGSPSQPLINAAANAGFNAVRIPCAWDSHANQTTYKIDPAYMAQVKQVVDWCLAKNMHVVINCHWDGGWLENHLTGTVNPIIDAKMKAYWSQIATAFSAYDSRLLFAAANEPNVDSAAKMAELKTYYQSFVNAVRLARGKNSDRWLVFQGPVEFWTGFPNEYRSVSPGERLNGTPRGSSPQSSSRFVYEAHWYTPSLFTIIHDDPSWGRSIYYWGQGYHSATDPTRNATWGEENEINAEFQTLYERFVSKGIPVILGEYGAFRTPNLTGPNSDLNFAATTYWNKYIQDAARSRGISPFFWSTPGSIFNWATGAVTNQDTLNSVSSVSAAVAPAGGDGAQCCFELSTQGWGGTGSPIGSTSISQNQKFKGTSSLAVNFNGTLAGVASAYVSSPAVPPGRTVSFNLYVPSNHPFGWVQAYAMDRNWAWLGAWRSGASLTKGAWNTISVTIPANAHVPLQQIGIQFSTTSAWTGTCYVDSVSW
ncbi:MAG: cellulase family glycosylhydrolase [Armatimonadetes bacterium]|nr:cellulase family glycosylhydrolase [Armatimonadota bacterium]